MKKDARPEKTKFWRDPALGNLELLHATFVTHNFARHTHDSCYVIGVIERGAEEFEYLHARHTASAGQIVFVNPGEPHTGQAATKEGWTYRTMYPDADLMQQAVSQIVGRERDIPFFREAVVSDPELAAQLIALHRSFEDVAAPLERQSQLLWLYAQLIARYADDQPALRPVNNEPTAVARVRDFLESQYAENILLKDLAALANLSPFHLLRVFRQEIGLPPHAYQNQVRVRRAKDLLAAGLPIVQAAADTGFTDQSHLNKHFKRIMGVTPGHYLLNISANLTPDYNL